MILRHKTVIKSHKICEKIEKKELYGEIDKVIKEISKKES